MSGVEFDLWGHYFAKEPFGPVQEDLRAAYPAMLLYNANRKTGSRALELGDFFPSLARPAEERYLSPRAEVLMAKLWVAAVGGRIEDGDGNAISEGR